MKINKEIIILGGGMVGLSVAHQLIERIGRLERKLGTKTQTSINLSLLKSWINRAKNYLDNNELG